MKVKNKLVVVGDYTWKDIRDLVIVELTHAETEEQFAKVISNLLASTGSLEDIKKTRKKLGIKPLTKQQENELKDVEA
jgi:hypothetical protein